MEAAELLALCGPGAAKEDGKQFGWVDGGVASYLGTCFFVGCLFAGFLVVCWFVCLLVCFLVIFVVCWLLILVGRPG